MMNGSNIYWLAGILLLIILTGSLFACHRSRSADVADISMIPWRSANGKFSFVDSSGQQLDEPRFVDAKPSQNGYAIAAKDTLEYGVVNAKGQTVLPFKYAAINLVKTSGSPIAITKTEYSAWWRFREWKLFPELDILFGSGLGKHWIVTYVPRAVWKIQDLQSQKTLFKTNQSDDYGPPGGMYWKKGWKPYRRVPADINAQAWDDGFMLAQYSLFKKNQNHGLTKQVADIFGRLTDDTFLQQTGDSSYSRVDASGKLREDTTYTLEKSIHFRDAGDQMMSVPKAMKHLAGQNIINAPIFKNGDSSYYLFPDLSTPLPTMIPNYNFDDGTIIKGKEIINGTVQLSTVPNSPWFLLLSAIKKSEADTTGGYYAFLIDSDGQWAPDYQPRKGLHSVRGDGRLIFRRKSPYGVLDTSLTFHPLPMQDFHTSNYSNHSYIGSDGNVSGVYDLKKNSGRSNWIR
jgi:hypothetical protein